jgi:hypothetical protein
MARCYIIALMNTPRLVLAQIKTCTLIVSIMYQASVFLRQLLLWLSCLSVPGARISFLREFNQKPAESNKNKNHN